MRFLELCLYIVPIIYKNIANKGTKTRNSNTIKTKKHRDTRKMSKLTLGMNKSLKTLRPKVKVTFRTQSKGEHSLHIFLRDWMSLLRGIMRASLGDRVQECEWSPTHLLFKAPPMSQSQGLHPSKSLLKPQCSGCRTKETMHLKWVSVITQ